jgi:hypothetical protein
MTVVPEEMPVTMPFEDPTVPTAALLLLHMPPAVILLKVVVAPTQVPSVPVIGDNGLLRNIDTLLEIKFVTAMSGLPSPSISPIATLKGFDPVANVTCVAKDPLVMLSLLLVFRNTDTV